LREDGLLLMEMEMCVVGNEEPHERELGLIERVELVRSESAERSD
jgi:hypothetical protein